MFLGIRSLRGLVSLAAAVAVVSFTSDIAAQSPTYQLQLSPQDTSLNLDATNHSAQTLLTAYTWPDNQVANVILLKFDLSTLPAGATVQQAVVSLALVESDATADATYTMTANKQVGMNPVIAAATGYTSDGVTPWTPSGCCYNGVPMAQSDLSAPYASLAVDKALGFKTWTITAMVQEWLASPASNFGLALNSDVTAARDRYRYFASTTNADPTLRPVLQITYSVPDTTAPTVSLSSPAAGTTVNGVVTLSAQATDNVGVAGVQFNVDGVNQGAEDTVSPYTTTWNTTAASNGSHTLTAVARDAAGNSATATNVSVTVNNADVTAPTVSMTAPANGTIVSGTAVTVSATAADNVGVVGVQFKLDGANLGAEDTASPYTISWNSTPTANGTHALTAVARDAAGNTTTSATVTVTVSNASLSSTIWNASATPNHIVTTDNAAVELGVRFRADVNGSITGIRFYKADTNTGTHVGNLWTNAGTRLATATFSGETASGWQQVTFSSPVAITANTTYVASYHTNVGQYGADLSYFATVGFDNPPLHALANGVAGVTGAFLYGAGGFPTQMYQSSNYWVDVVFTAGGGGDSTAPTVAITAPANGATVSGSAFTVSATASDNVGVGGVQFKLDGINLGAEDTASPYATTWNTTTASSGSHTLTAVARDAAGNAATATTVTVTVNNADVTPPTASMTAPANGTTVSGTAVTLSATAADNVGVVGVQFKLDGISLGAEDTASPYATTWNATTASAGSHTLTAVARDAAGNTATAAAVTVTVTVSNGPTVVNVSTEPQLQSAVQQLVSNTIISLAPGTYVLSSTLAISGAFTNVTITGSTTNRDDVVLQGAGMNNASYGTVPNGISTAGNVQALTIANLTVRSVYLYPILFDVGTQSPRVSNVHLVDAGQQFIRSNADASGAGVNNGIVEDSLIEYTTTSRDANTNGVDVIGGANWIIRRNLFRNIVAPAGLLAGPAVLAVAGASNTLTERNTFLNCGRGIAYGIWNPPGTFDHTGGIIRNNIVYRSSTQPGDVGISVNDSPNTLVLNNTVVLSGTYPAPIEYRFVGSTGVVLKNNLLDGVISARDGATGTEQNNLAGATAALFVNAAAGDLHLAGSATAAIDHGLTLTDVIDDIDGQARPAGAAYDIGADEYLTTSDTTPPAISMTAPANGAAVSGTAVTVSANASDNIGVVGVQFKLDGVNLGAEDTASPYTNTWNTTTTPNGSHTLTAVARDAAGNTATATIVTVTVNNTDTTSPTDSMTAPANGATVSSTAVMVSANAADNVGVVGVQFKLDGANLGPESMTSPYSRMWDTTAGSNGSHTLTAVARDAAGNTATAAMVTVTVNNTDVTPPTASMTAPGNGTTVSGAAVTVSATAADNVGVVGVQFKLDGVNLGTEDSATPYTTTWNTTTAANGSHSVTAVARDAAGNNVTAAAVTVTVNNADVTPPTASMTAPANGATVSGTAVTVSATASDNIGVTGVQFQLDGVNLGANDATSPYTISWNTTTATAGSHSLTAVARDAAGNSLTSSAITVTVANDVTPPVISSVAAAAITTTSATIVWTTNENSDSQVDYGLTTSYGSSSTLNATPVTSHSVPLSGLNASTTYHARARSRDAAGNLSISGDVTFATGAISPPLSGWPHEPAGFAAFASSSLDAFSGNGWDIVNSSGLATVVADAGGLLTPPNVGQWKYPSGFGGGTAPATMFHPLPQSFNEGFVGTMWKVSNPWQGHSTFVNKIFFLLGGACGNLIPIMYGPNGGPYQLRVAPEWGNWSWLTPNVNDVPITLGSWHRIELYFKYNTPGSGIVRWWMDGTLIGDYTNITFPSSGCLAEFQYSPTWGGVGDVKNETDFFWFDDAYISIPSGTASPPPPPPPPSPPPAGTVLFQENFEDANVAGRGWYDNTAVQLSTTEHIANSVSSIQYTFLQGATTPTAGSALRKTFTPTDSVYLGYWVKHSANWVGSQQTYHPHEFHFLTNLDGVWSGLSFNFLTTYIEENAGTPLIGIQDGINVDQTKIGVNLTNVTERRGVAGCNGSSDGYADNCYSNGTAFVNEKKWRAAAQYFTDTAGAFYKSDWHFVEAFVKMNSIVSGKGTNDGVVQYWFDGQLIIDHHDVLLRTGANATMQFAQFVIAPYIGDGSPVTQSLWFDNLTVATGRP